MKRTAWIVVGWLVMGGLAQAASFDCTKAGMKVEKLICADAELSRLDEELNVAYKTALQNQTQAEAIQYAQKQWMKGRNGCVDAACLKLTYVGRLQELLSPASASSIWALPKKLTSSSDAKKGCYQLVVGKRFAMCREFEKNLNRFCDESPMRRVNINPEFGKNFSMPKWEELDPSKNINLVAEIVRSHFRALVVETNPENATCIQQCPEQGWQRDKPFYMEGIRSGQVVLSRARFDLNHDGIQELVYRLSGSQYLPDDSGRRVYKPNFTLMVMDEKTGKEAPDFASSNNAGVDVLLYQGRTHLVTWDDGSILDGNAELGTTMGMPEGMSGGNLSIHDILTGGPNVGRYHPLMLPLCGYNRLDKEEM